jgi:hypothetical protein
VIGVVPGIKMPGNLLDNWDLSTNYVDVPYMTPKMLPLKYGMNVHFVRCVLQQADRFPIKNGLKQGDALSPLLFNFALQYAITRVQAYQEDLKLNGTHQL